MKKPQMKLKFFVTQTGRSLVGVLKKYEDGHILLEGTAFVDIAADQTRFIFTPIKFVPGDFKLYGAGLLGEAEMPAIMQPGYLEYWKTLPGKKAKKK